MVLKLQSEYKTKKKDYDKFIHTKISSITKGEVKS
jgi:hypothetical protein